MLAFHIAIVAITYPIYISGGTPFHRAENAVLQFAAIWLVCFPSCAFFLVFLDRVLDCFDGRPTDAENAEAAENSIDWLAVYEKKFGRFEEDGREADNVIEFDPKKFN